MSYNTMGIYKYHQVVVRDQEKLVIDNNEKVAKKIEYLTEQMMKEASAADGTELLDGFSSGLDAECVEALTAEGDEELPSVIKASPSEAEEAAAQAQNTAGRQSASEALSIVSAQAEEMLAAARREAENIKSHALIEVQIEIENLRKTAMEEARTEGYEAGYQEGVAEVEQERNSLLEQKKKMEDEYQQLISELEPKFVDTLTDIYEKVFRVDLKKEQDIIMHLISSTMQKIEGSSNYLIHVSKEDYSYVNLKKQDVLMPVVSPNASIEVVEDITLGANDCIIETDGGVFDCGLGTQLDDLAQKLKLLSYRRN